jgi:predicted DNA-binding transcriptional regulator YafY
MPVNRNALIRYRTIDNCLRNKFKKYTLEDLVQACSDALYEYEGIDKGVSTRTVQMDIQLMRSDKLGYNAPILVEDKKYYRYEDPEYSITNIPLTDQDLGKLTEVVEILRQFKGFSHFQELSGMVQRLENKIYTAKTNAEPIIDFEKNDHLKGLEHIDTLYQAIIKKSAIIIDYQSFKARTANAFDFHPYFLKEYRNRWFVIGIRKRDAEMMNLALDRIISISECPRAYIPKKKELVLSEYFNDVLGVSISAGAAVEKVTLFVDTATAPYVVTKPIHHSQKVEETLTNGIVVSFHVQLNFELERELLGFGDRIRVLGPERLRRQIKERLSAALDSYQYELSDKTLRGAMFKLASRGTLVLRHVFSRKEVNRIKSHIDSYLSDRGEAGTYAIRNVLQAIPEIKPVLANSNLLNILSRINPALFLTKAIFFDKTPEANWHVTWHQDIIINVAEKIETPGYTGWTKKTDHYGVCPPDEILHDTITIRIHLDDADEHNGALQVLPGSHKKKHTDDEIRIITQSSEPSICEVHSGGVHILKPLLLHASARATNQKHRRVIHLEFNSVELPNGLTWAERQALS